ncbi:thioredoxin family protein [Sorangium sp. So ce854]|uniref:thioredoxin family protein n=1 Tax=Sorangium sp. So ce854 TaxID=3133322 RepID=UPI003F6078FF
MDLVEASIHSFSGAVGDPIAGCVKRDREVMARDLAFKLVIGTRGMPGKAAEMAYYRLLQERRPDELIPIVYLRKYYHEGLLGCVLGSVEASQKDAMAESEVRILVGSNFEAETGDGLVMIDFMTHWCVPCKRMAPDLEMLARSYKGTLRVGRINVDRNMGIAERFGVGVFPTLVMLKNGKEVGRVEKLLGYAELSRWVEGELRGSGSPSGQAPRGGEQRRGESGD